MNLLHTHKARQRGVSQVHWSPDGRRIAYRCRDGSIGILDAIYATTPIDERVRMEWRGEDGLLMYSNNTKHRARSIAWESGGDRLIVHTLTGDLVALDASRKQVSLNISIATDLPQSSWNAAGTAFAAWSESRLQLLDNRDIKNPRAYNLHGFVGDLIWAPDGRHFAVAGSDGLMFGDVAGPTVGPPCFMSENIQACAWDPSGEAIATGRGPFITIWRTGEKEKDFELEGHVRDIDSVTFSRDGLLLASRSTDEMVRVWRTDSWECVGVLEFGSRSTSPVRGALSFSPDSRCLASVGINGEGIQIWRLEPRLLEGQWRALQYRNAKVLLVGDTGVGKTGLALALTGRRRIPTDSTHARHVWMLKSEEAPLPNGKSEMREVWLWDLGGQPGYRLVHQLHLHEAAVVLVIMDAHSDAEPFAGVDYWIRALQHSKWSGRAGEGKAVRLLVAGRADRGVPRVSPADIKEKLAEGEFAGYFITSATDGEGVYVLQQAVLANIDWERSSPVSSNQLFQDIRSFILDLGRRDVVIETPDVLCERFLSEQPSLYTREALAAAFPVCLERLESRGVIRRLRLGDFVLLRPEVLDSYAYSLVATARAERDGLGVVSEEVAVTGRFTIDESARIADARLQQLVLFATVEELLRHDVVLREQTPRGTVLVFPSELTTERPRIPEDLQESLVMLFEGAVMNIYASLVVRLASSGRFARRELWKNGAAFTSEDGVLCGFFMRDRKGGEGELTILTGADESRSDAFIQYAYYHLLRTAAKDSVMVYRTLKCPNCGTGIDREKALIRAEDGHEDISCWRCDHHAQISGTLIPVLSERQVTDLMRPMDQQVSNARNLEANRAAIAGKRAMGLYDVFCCFNEEDEGQVERVVRGLGERGVLAFWPREIAPGRSWLRELEKAIDKIPAAAVFLGQSGVGPWQRAEYEGILRRHQGNQRPVIPVILESLESKATPEMPLFLGGWQWVDLRKGPKELDNLVWGITGRRRLKGEDGEGPERLQLPV